MGRDGMAGCRRARWHLLGVVGQEVGGEVGGPDSRGGEAGGGWQGTRWGRSSGGKEGQMGNKGGDGRVQEGQMRVSVGGGVVGGW